MTEAANELLRGLFDSAVASVAAERCLPPHLPTPPKGRTLVIGAGKAAAAMAKVVENHWPNGSPLSGIAITRYGHGVHTSTIRVIEAGHPLPDEPGEQITRAVIALTSELKHDDMLLCLLSGGGSALMAAPAPGISLNEKRQVTDDLLRSGATIAEINCVRKHLSAVKGGQLAGVAAPARVVNLMVSDVASNDPTVIASGPTVPDPTTLAEARSIIEKYRINVPPPITAHLLDADRETPKPGDPVFASSTTTVIATARDALKAAEKVARDAGYTPLILGGALEGDATTIARQHSDQVREGRQQEGPIAIISGGELTVTITGQGHGGPNQEYLLALALSLGPEGGVYALACDTDGIDGSEDNAGARITPDTLIRAQRQNLNPEAYLRENNSYEFFRLLGDLIVTGPTRTNVNDFRVILVPGKSPMNKQRSHG
jgi:hydroxypyruvate reductase